VTRASVLVADRGEEGADSTEPPTSSRLGHRPKVVRASVAIVLGGVFLAAGAVGLVRYVQTFWLYRGFPPPVSARFVTVGSGAAHRRVPVYAGSLRTVAVPSPALGGRRMQVLLYLPPNYAADAGTRYPVLYLLHGDPGSPAQFVNVGDVATTSDDLLAEGRIRPMIVVMPSGSPNFFTDEEWANSVRPHSDWETYVAHDLVAYVTAHYRTIDSGSQRGLGGPSEGGYGAFNIGFHHVGEFDLIEAWSPYYVASTAPQFFGQRRALLAYNSPAVEAPAVAAGLRSHDAYVWYYIGGHDRKNQSSFAFAQSLLSRHVSVKFTIDSGRHTWKLWRSHMSEALEAASGYFQHGAPPPSPLPPRDA